MGLTSWLTWNTYLIVGFVIYMGWTATSFYELMNPQLVAGRVHPETGEIYPTIDPAWPEKSTLSMQVFMSKYDRMPRKAHGTVKVWETNDIQFDWGMSEKHLFETNLTMNTVPEELWQHLESNGTLYLHYNLKCKGSSDQLWATSTLVRFVEQEPPKPERYLVKDWPILGDWVPTDPVIVRGVAASLSNTNRNTTTHTVGLWKPEASVHLVADWTSWPVPTTPVLVRRMLRMDSSGHKYLPVVYTDQLGLTREKMHQVNKTMRVRTEPLEPGTIDYDTGVLPLSISVAPMTVARWQFNAQMEQALEMQKAIGASNKDLDDMRYMLTETPPLLLGITLTVSLVHILFDILAFKNDVQFWNNTESMKGLSLRQVVMELFSSVIITAYLKDNKTSYLVLVPSAIGIVVQTWKVWKALRLNSGAQDAKVVATQEFDSYAVRLMMWVLVPVVVGYAFYSLVFHKHTSFYSWLVKSLAGSVYAFGFAMMTPQLFINYKLKSVAHLPWRFLVYRSMNTFIDDLFAFIIRMPNMHRAAVFRDDLVFFIYLYQRWIYPVDKDRKESPSGEALETVDTSDTKTKETKKDK